MQATIPNLKFLSQDVEVTCAPKASARLVSADDITGEISAAIIAKIKKKIQ